MYDEVTAMKLVFSMQSVASQPNHKKRILDFQVATFKVKKPASLWTFGRAKADSFVPFEDKHFFTVLVACNNGKVDPTDFLGFGHEVDISESIRAFVAGFIMYGSRKDIVLFMCPHPTYDHDAEGAVPTGLVGPEIRRYTVARFVGGKGAKDIPFPKASIADESATSIVRVQFIEHVLKLYSPGGMLPRPSKFHDIQVAAFKALAKSARATWHSKLNPDPPLAGKGKKRRRGLGMGSQSRSRKRRNASGGLQTPAGKIVDMEENEALDHVGGWNIASASTSPPTQPLAAKEDLKLPPVPLFSQSSLRDLTSAIASGVRQIQSPASTGTSSPALRDALIARIERTEAQVVKASDSYAGRMDSMQTELSTLRCSAEKAATTREAQYHELILSSQATHKVTVEGMSQQFGALSNALGNLQTSHETNSVANRDTQLQIADMVKQALAAHTEGQLSAMGKFVNYIQLKDERQEESQRRLLEFVADKVDAVAAQQNALQNLQSKQEGIALAMVDQANVGRNVKRALTEGHALPSASSMAYKRPFRTKLLPGSTLSDLLDGGAAAEAESGSSAEEEDVTKDPEFQQMLAKYLKKKKEKKKKMISPDAEQ
jgi:hypothetical protein